MNQTFTNARRILVVEDNRDAADSQAELLELWGYQVAVAYDGLAGVGQAFTFRPAVVVMDIGLPLLDGYQAARLIRDQPALAGIRLIALTGYGREEDRQRAYDAGFDHHLTKPADLERLREMISPAPK